MLFPEVRDAHKGVDSLMQSAAEAEMWPEMQISLQITTFLFFPGDPKDKDSDCSDSLSPLPGPH